MIIGSHSQIGFYQIPEKKMKIFLLLENKKINHIRQNAKKRIIFISSLVGIHNAALIVIPSSVLKFLENLFYE